MTDGNVQHTRNLAALAVQAWLSGNFDGAASLIEEGYPGIASVFCDLLAWTQIDAAMRTPDGSPLEDPQTMWVNAATWLAANWERFGADVHLSEAVGPRPLEPGENYQAGPVVEQFPAADLTTTKLRSLTPVRQWGPWRLKLDTYELVLPAGLYYVDLEDCTDSAHVLDWIVQVGRKSWGADTLAVHSGITNALGDVLHLQRNMCSFGEDTPVTADWIRAQADEFAAKHPEVVR